MRHPRPRVGGICTQLRLPPPPGLPPQPRPTHSARRLGRTRWWEQRPGSGCAPRGWFPVGARQGGSILSLHSQGQEKDGVGVGGSLRPWVDPAAGWGPRGSWVVVVPPVSLKGPRHPAHSPIRINNPLRLPRDLAGVQLLGLQSPRWSSAPPSTCCLVLCPAAPCCLAKSGSCTPSLQSLPCDIWGPQTQ